MKLTVGVAVFAVGLSLSLVAHAEQAGSPVSLTILEQNAIVQKYCAVCHDDIHRNGGLSLQHFDASHVEPSLAAMMTSKLKSGAMGAAGLGLPDHPTQDAFLDALLAKSSGAKEWALTRTLDPATQAPVVTAGIIREGPSMDTSENPELYRLKLTCRTDTHEAEMQLAWSPTPARSPRTVSVAADSGSPVIYTVEGREKMGNGAKQNDGTEVVSGPAAFVLRAMPLPKQTLTISNIFLGETVVFPFEGMTSAMRQELSTCFTGVRLEQR